jgi:hypothetical protein
MIGMVGIAGIMATTAVTIAMTVIAGNSGRRASHDWVGGTRWKTGQGAQAMADAPFSFRDIPDGLAVRFIFGPFAVMLVKLQVLMP